MDVDGASISLEELKIGNKRALPDDEACGRSSSDSMLAEGVRAHVQVERTKAKQLSRRYPERCSGQQRVVVKVREKKWGWSKRGGVGRGSQPNGAARRATHDRLSQV